MGVSKDVDSAIGMGLATTFVMVVAAGNLDYSVVHFRTPGTAVLQTLSFILVIAAMVQLVEMFLHKTSPGLYRAMGIFLPLITTNCAILGFAIMGVQNSYTFIETVVFGLGAGLGFTLALVLMAGIREDLQFADIPKPLRGVGIAFILAGLLSLAFGGFAGLV